MKKQFIVFYNDDGLIKSIGIWQRMNSTGERFLIEFIDYEEMIVICNTNSHIETRYKSRIIENCKWIDAEEIKNSKHAFIQLRDEKLLKDEFIKSESVREFRRCKGMI